MKWRSRILAGLLVAAVAVSTAGCMDKGSGSKSSEKSVKRVEPPADIWDPYEETVTLTTVLPENAGIKWKDGDSYDDNPWYRAYKERFNIDVKNKWVSNDYTTKLNLTLADGDIPDVMFATNEQYQQLVEADLLLDLTDIFDTYASDRLKGYMEQEKDTYQTAMVDGKLLGIPQLSYGIIDNPSQVWIRKDWMEASGLKDPETMEDLEHLAKAFQEERGGYVMTEDKNLTCMKNLAVGFGAHPGIWIEQADGTIGYGTVQPEMKEVLETYARWYKEGLINPEFTITNLQKMNQGVVNGEAGISVYAQYWGYDPGQDVVANNGKEAVYDAYAIPSATGEPVKASISFANYGYIVINKNCKNPEAAMKLLNFYAYMMDEAQETETTEFIDSLFSNAYTNIPYAFRVINPNTDYQQFEQVTAALEKYEKGEEVDIKALGKNAIKYNNSVAFMETGAPEGVGDWCQQGSPKSAYRISKELIDKELYVKDEMWGTPPASVSQTVETLKAQLEEGFTKIIVGEQPVDYFDTLVEEWMKAGGEQATTDINAEWGN